MKKIFTFIIILLFTQNCFGLVLTETQFKNLDLLHKELSDKYPNFKGFNGSRTEMGVIGISEKDAQKEIDKIDLQKALEKDEKYKLRKDIRKKLKNGHPLDDDEIDELLGKERVLL